MKRPRRDSPILSLRGRGCARKPFAAAAGARHTGTPPAAAPPAWSPRADRARRGQARSRAPQPAASALSSLSRIPPKPPFDVTPATSPWVSRGGQVRHDASGAGDEPRRLPDRSRPHCDDEAPAPSRRFVARVRIDSCDGSNVPAGSTTPRHVVGRPAFSERAARLPPAGLQASQRLVGKDVAAAAEPLDRDGVVSPSAETRAVDAGPVGHGHVVLGNRRRGAYRLVGERRKPRQQGRGFRR